MFHAPQIMFDCLQQRISAGSRKKRLPNYTTGFVRRDALPLGIFTKYTWHIVNILHVKQIFDTPEVRLGPALFGPEWSLSAFQRANKKITCVAAITDTHTLFCFVFFFFYYPKPKNLNSTSNYYFIEAGIAFGSV